MKRISIRFFNERKIRAVWDEAGAKWWFSVLDIVGAINDEDDYSKTRNYWKYLKTKLKREKNELVSATSGNNSIRKVLFTLGKLRSFLR